MATQNKIVEIIFGIKTIYPYYAKETDVESLVKTWTMLLHDIPDDLAEAAFYQALRVCKVPPTPADLIEQINAMKEASKATPEELWTVYHKALRDTMRLLPQFNYTYVDSTGISQGQQARNKVQEIWNCLPEEIQQYLVSKSELIRAAHQMMVTPPEDVKWEKKQFIKALPTIAKRAENSAVLIAASNAKLIGHKPKK